MHTFVHQKIFTKIFIVALFLVAQDWKQPKYLPIVEWVNCRIVIAISKQTTYNRIDESHKDNIELMKQTQVYTAGFLIL